MQQQNIISSSCRATPTKYTHNSFSHLLQHTLSFKLNIKLIFLISLIFLSVLIEAPPIPLSTPDLRSFAYYAAAAYRNPLTDWNCGEVCQATQGTKLVKEFGNPGHNTKGFIALDESEKLIIVSYRGTQPLSVRNYITDGLAFKANYFPVRGANVHFGFYNAFQKVQPLVTGDVIKLHQDNPDFRIGFMGHSLGGALATFSALDVIQKVPELANNEKLFLATLGQPRVGDAAFAEYVDNNLKAVRTIIRGDPIPRFPSSWPIPIVGNYKHFGEELYIDNPDEDPNSFRECSAEDPSCSESIPLRQCSFKRHSGPYYGVNMRDPGSQADDEFDENYDFSTDPYFVYDPNFDYSALGVNGTKGVNGVDDAKGVNGVDGAKGINGTKGINGVDGAKGVNGTK